MLIFRCFAGSTTAPAAFFAGFGVALGAGAGAGAGDSTSGGTAAGAGLSSGSGSGWAAFAGGGTASLIASVLAKISTCASVKPKTATRLWISDTPLPPFIACFDKNAVWSTTCARR